MSELTEQHITSISPTGHGVIEQNNAPIILVLGAFPGDIINIHIYKKLQHIWYAEITHIISGSNLREYTPPASPFFISNMPWQHLTRSGELQLKDNIFNSIYPQYSSNISMLQDIGLPDTHYRNKVAYAFTTDTRGQLHFALYTRGTDGAEKEIHTENTLVHPMLEKTGRDFLDFFNQYKVTESDIKYLILRYSYNTNTVVAQILFPETSRKKLPLKKAELEKYLSRTHNLEGILVSHSHPNVRSAITTKDFYTLGNIDITEKLLDKKYIYHPSLFFQIYPDAFNEILKDLYREIESIPDHKKIPVLDLFAGVGVIGMSIADLVFSVRGVELSSLSKKYALENAHINNIDTYSFTEASVHKVLDYIESDQILIIDPTRSGLSKETCQRIIQVQPRHIVYISCNLGTQARDLDMIKDFYTITFMGAYNIFPKTHHIESMVILERKKND